MKTRTNLSVDIELLEKAKQAQLNISAVLENAIRNKLVSAETDIVGPGKCQICGKAEEKATAQDPIGLTWLSPDEIWICDKCLTVKKRSVGIRVG